MPGDRVVRFWLLLSHSRTWFEEVEVTLSHNQMMKSSSTSSSMHEHLIVSFYSSKLLPGELCVQHSNMQLEVKIHIGRGRGNENRISGGVCLVKSKKSVRKHINTIWTSFTLKGFNLFIHRWKNMSKVPCLMGKWTGVSWTLSHCIWFSCVSVQWDDTVRAPLYTLIYEWIIKV